MPDDPADTPWIYLAGIPYEPCTLTYIVTAEIGSVMAETQVTVQFYECELPQNLGFDRCYTLEKNESRLITADFGEFGPAEADPRISVFCYMNDEGDVVSTDIETTFNEEDEETGFGIRVTGLQPGAVTLPAIASQKGLVWRGDITFIVLNEDGTLPELPELGFSETDTNRANEKPLCPAGDPHFSLDDTVNDLNLINADFYRNLTGEEPIFTWEQTSGPELELEIRDGALRMVGQIAEPDILTYTITVSIGEYSASTGMTVRFFTRDLPDDIGFASSYTLGIGERVELRALFSGTGWEDGAFHGVFVLDWDFDDVVSVEELESWEAWEYYLSVTGLRPGITYVLVRADQDGLNWDGLIRFTVLNEDGTLPEEPSVENVLVLPGDLLEIDDEAFRGTAAEKIIIPSGCVSIGHLAFAYSSFLRELEIPASVITLENDMLQGCDLSLVIITPENSPAWQWAEAHGIDVRTE